MTAPDHGLRSTPDHGAWQYSGRAADPHATAFRIVVPRLTWQNVRIHRALVSRRRPHSARHGECIRTPTVRGSAPTLMSRRDTLAPETTWRLTPRRSA